MNAINGMANLITKSPFTYQGLSLYQNTGVNHVDGIDDAPSYSNRICYTLCKSIQ